MALSAANLEISPKKSRTQKAEHTTAGHMINSAVRAGITIQKTLNQPTLRTVADAGLLNQSRVSTTLGRRGNESATGAIYALD
jgi:hypothetical protein